MVFHWFYKVFCSPGGSKMASIFDRFFDRFWYGFWIVFGRCLGGQGGPKTPQDGPRRGQDAPRWPQDVPNTATRRPQDAPRRPQDALRRHKACQDGPKMRPRRPRGSKMPQGAAKMDEDSAKMAHHGLKMAQDGSRWFKMAKDGPHMASRWPPVYRWIWMCAVLPPAARRQMLRDVGSFAARRPPADASRCGSLCRPPPARRCIEIRQDVLQGFLVKRASAVLNRAPSCSRELSSVTRFPFFC